LKGGSSLFGTFKSGVNTPQLPASIPNDYLV